MNFWLVGYLVCFKSFQGVQLSIKEKLTFNNPLRFFSIIISLLYWNLAYIVSLIVNGENCQIIICRFTVSLNI